MLIVVPAVVISTVIGAFNGYVLTKWKFWGCNLLFGMLLIGTMIPFQVSLLSMARTTTALIMEHSIYGLTFTPLFLRNYYISIPSELVNAARIILPVSVPIIVVSVIWPLRLLPGYQPCSYLW